MSLEREWKAVLLMLGGFLAAYHLPMTSVRFLGGIMEALHLLRDYAREHVVACLLPAFLIAGGLAVFLKRESVMRYLGPRARKVVAYAVASVSGTVLAVCSCTVLPLFAGIYRMGAGLGPASAFLYAGPAINILAIVLTANVLGWRLGAARAVGAVVFSVVVGLLMHLLYRRSEAERSENAGAFEGGDDDGGIAHWKGAVILLLLAGFLVSANWVGADGGECACGVLGGDRWEVPAALALLVAGLSVVWLGVRWQAAGLAAAAVIAAALVPGWGRIVPYGVGVVGFSAALAFSGGEAGKWFEESWGFAKLIVPLLFAGVLVAGALLGRPGHEGWIPSEWIETAVGGNSLRANFFASIAGAFMYFATLTEIPIVQGLVGSGMGGGPALALLLAGPALSLPNMLVIRSVLGTSRTLTFVSLVVVMATASGLIYGAVI
jgi:hypothetical protein